MPTIKLMNQAGEAVGNIDLSEAVFGAEPNQQITYEVVKAQRAAMRQGNASTKNRSMVRGGGRKPYRQKGTGHARQGTIRAPQFVGGGTVFGPSPRSYSYKVNKKIRRQALRISLSDKVREESLVVVDKITLESFKTKGVVEILANLKLEGKIMVVLDTIDETFDIASRNLPNVIAFASDHISVYDVMNSAKVLATEAAIKKIEEVLG
ncbi:MAG TPA: 50S ribosomal protein L4 [Bacillota bacterium]|nr:50S ribosomal protein L4 [Bacillota bacterium]HPF41992.1 50S ribosomal protein L4 [Bacillota bacterium]HPJ85934.1 50S ribosomal protein L4 [Bacillota bacterium]HPQ61828.1 50S ribosomal protein L4 [Bacillota bacterium]HRX91195.1 50S ribosomal protein L4 [Candidatus Izemoplasmatales bacterium]